MRIALALTLPVLLVAQSALLEIRVIEGAGAVYAPESRTPGLVVEVTDELGKPVPGAVVSLRLPDDGAGGSFANGLSSEILTTGSQGRATTSPVRWNRVPGTVEIRVTAVKAKLRAGTVATCEISGSAKIAGRGGAGKPAATGAQPLPIKHKGFPTKWVAIGVVALAAAAGAGLAKGSSGSSGGGSGSGSNPGTPGGVQIGAPSITIGKP
ncbi:MAG TPA: hypothetical protein VF767_05440 [Bryobacteraceae bacterium]